MKTLETILENYEGMETLDARLGRRLCQFLTIEQMAKIGFTFQDKESEQNHKPIAWTEENVLKQLKEDLEFGIEKATHHRGLSAGMMWEVCHAWCEVLENGLDKEFDPHSDADYGYYGDKLFKAIDKKYNFGLVKPNTFNKEFYREW